MSLTKDFVDRDDNFNHRTGGVANIEFSEEARQKISDNNPMKRADVREKVAQAVKESWTQERREERSKNNWMKKEENKHLISGENHPWYGRQHTEESKEKISRANAGRVRSKDAIEAQREKIKGYWSDPEWVAQRKSTKGIPKPEQGTKVRDFYRDNTEILDTKTGKIHNSLDEIIDVLAAEGIHRKKTTVSEYVRGVSGKKLGLDKRFRYLKNPKQRQ